MQQNLNNLGDFKAFTRYNDYQHVPVYGFPDYHDPAETICSRYDLRTHYMLGNQTIDPAAFGCQDSKTVNHEQVYRMQMSFVVGPTVQSIPTALPPFSMKKWNADHPDPMAGHCPDRGIRT